MQNQGVAETQAAPTTRRRVLVVDDQLASADGLRQTLEHWDYDARSAGSGEEALRIIDEFMPDAVVCDLVMPGMSGIQVMERLDDRLRDLVFIILTAQGTIETAVESIQKGAFNYMTKPVDLQQLRVLLQQAGRWLDKDREVRALRQQLQATGWFGRLRGQSAPMRQLYTMIEQVAPSAASVMITGESGTGKELVAKTIHALSPRASKPFIPINCAAIPETLLESELFGHEKGSFTGAYASREGCFELANGGTVFLDEIGEMPGSLQAKLLRAIEERSFRRVGGKSEIQVDVRVIAATNRDVEEARRQGALRDDLYYRLNVFHIELPPLRGRVEDVLLLAQHFVEEVARRESRKVTGLDREAQQLLMLYPWPGNVRELRNAIERAVIVASGDTITAENLPPSLRGGASRSEPAWVPGMTVEEVERLLILATLERTSNNKTQAAKLLGISLKTLHNKLRRYREEGKLGTSAEADAAGEAEAAGVTEATSELAEGDELAENEASA